MQSVLESVAELGFSEEVSQRLVAGHQRHSTLQLYNSRWQLFAVWCQQRDFNPRTATVTAVADFLLYLFNEKRLGPSAIEGYRSAINSVWRLEGRTLQDSYPLISLLKSFKAERPRSVVTFPKWDLALVLRVLSKDPYEPIASAAPIHLTRKTVFLLLLASARRVGDIHAIDPRRMVVRQNTVILEPYPGYLPKIASTAEGQPRYTPIVIRSLRSLTTDSDELVLCPVRALLAYNAYAEAKVPNRKRFFLPVGSRGNAVQKQTLSAWTAALIRHAYQYASEQDCQLSSTSTHEVRALAASMAYQATFALSHILASATWAQPTTFIEHYLRDVSGLQGRLHVIGPCVVAGHTLH